MRKFTAVNAAGETFNLMRKDAFFYTPKGLGVEYANTYMRSGSAYIATKRDVAQGSISGKMIFSSYSAYTEFARFASQQPIKLKYKPSDATYTIDVLIGELSKEEISHRSNRLECDLVLDCLSLWYITKPGVWSSSSEAAGGKVYDFEYTYTYSGGLRNKIRLQNNSLLDSPLRLSIFGTAYNPTWRVLVNGNTVASGSVTATIQSGNKMVLNSIDSNLEIAEYTTADAFVRNLYQNTDFSEPTFVYVPPGSSLLTLTSSDGGDILACAEVIELYEAV